MISVSRVNLDHTRFITVAGIDFVIHTPDQGRALDEGLTYLFFGQIRYWRCCLLVPGRETSGARFGDVLIFLGRVAADAYGADDLAVNSERNTSLKRCGARKDEGSDAAVLDLIFKLFTGPAENRGSARFADSDVDARDLRIVKPFKDNGIPAVVHDDDHDRCVSLLRLCLCGSGYFLGGF